MWGMYGNDDGNSAIGRRRRVFFAIGAIVLGMLVSAGGASRADVVLVEKAELAAAFQHRHECTSSPLTFNGPGVVSVRLKMSPYRPVNSRRGGRRSSRTACRTLGAGSDTRSSREQRADMASRWT